MARKKDATETKQKRPVRGYQISETLALRIGRLSERMLESEPNISSFVRSAVEEKLTRLEKKHGIVSG